MFEDNVSDPENNAQRYCYVGV